MQSAGWVLVDTWTKPKRSAAGSVESEEWLAGGRPAGEKRLYVESKERFRPGCEDSTFSVPKSKVSAVVLQVLSRYPEKRSASRISLRAS